MRERGGAQDDRLTRLGVGVVLAIVATGCVPLMTPPLKGDLGYAARLGGDTGYRFSAGTDVASLIPSSKFPLEAGGGYVQTSTKYGKSRTPIHGLYLEGGPKVAGGDWWRVFAGPRLEYYFAPRGPDPAYAGLVRAQIEIFKGALGESGSSDDSESDPAPPPDPPPDPQTGPQPDPHPDLPVDPTATPRPSKISVLESRIPGLARIPRPRPRPISHSTFWWGIAFGMAALGLYVEGGYQHLPNDAGYPLIGGGVLLRLPATAGVACCAWDWIPKKK